MLPVRCMVPQEQRGTAFGLFTAGFGISWFCARFADSLQAMDAMPDAIVA
jgi:hypothetical protein